MVAVGGHVMFVSTKQIQVATPILFLLEYLQAVIGSTGIKFMMDGVVGRMEVVVPTVVIHARVVVLGLTTNVLRNVLPKTVPVHTVKMITVLKVAMIVMFTPTVRAKVRQFTLASVGFLMDALVQVAIFLTPLRMVLFWCLAIPTILEAGHILMLDQQEPVI